MDEHKADHVEKKGFMESFNEHVSLLCRTAALVISVFAFATIIIGVEQMHYVVMGLCVSVALLAIASLQEKHDKKR